MRLLWLVLFAWLASAARADVGENFTVLSGQVTAGPPSRPQNTRLLAAGSQLQSGATVTTSGEAATVRLGDTTLRLAPKTQIRIHGRDKVSVHSGIALAASPGLSIRCEGVLIRLSGRATCVRGSDSAYLMIHEGIARVQGVNLYGPLGRYPKDSRLWFKAPTRLRFDRPDSTQYAFLTHTHAGSLAVSGLEEWSMEPSGNLPPATYLLQLSSTSKPPAGRVLSGLPAGGRKQETIALLNALGGALLLSRPGLTTVDPSEGIDPLLPEKHTSPFEPDASASPTVDPFPESQAPLPEASPDTIPDQVAVNSSQLRWTEDGTLELSEIADSNPKNRNRKHQAKDEDEQPAAAGGGGLVFGVYVCIGLGFLIWVYRAIRYQMGPESLILNFYTATQGGEAWPIHLRKSMPYLTNALTNGLFVARSDGTGRPPMFRRNLGNPCSTPYESMQFGEVTVQKNTGLATVCVTLNYPEETPCEPAEIQFFLTPFGSSYRINDIWHTWQGVTEKLGDWIEANGGLRGPAKPSDSD